MSPVRDYILGLSIRKQLSAILLLCLVPTCLLGFYFINRANSEIGAVDTELAGVEMLTEMHPAIEFIYNMPANPEARKAGAKRAITALEKALAHENHAEKFGVQKRGKAVLVNLRAIAAGSDTNADWAMNQLMTRIGDQTGLLLDPQLDSAYLARIMINRIPNLKRSARQLQQAYLSEEDVRAPLVILARYRVSDDARALQQAFAAASRGNPELSKPDNALSKINNVIKAGNKFVSGSGDVTTYRNLTAAKGESWLFLAKALRISLEKRRAAIQQEFWSATGISLAALLLVIAFSILMIGSLSRGLGSIRQRVENLSQGDYESPVPGANFENDIGFIAATLQDFIYLSHEIEQERAQAQKLLESTVAEVREENAQLLEEQLGQQAKQAEAERRATMHLANTLEEKVAGLLANSRSATMQLDDEANAMAQSSGRIKNSSSDAALVATQVRDNMENIQPVVAQVSDELSGYVDTLRSASELSENAVSSVNSAQGRITEFEQATRHVDDMLALITSIAQKTNMLALNASIEAARVGEAGQGFKVVADEVKSLATSTAETANDISSQVSAMKEVNGEVVGSFAEILAVVRQLAAKSDEITQGMDRQKRSISSVSDIVDVTSKELENMADQVANADNSASQTEEQSAEMLRASQHVASNVGELDEAVQNFLSDLKTAAKESRAA